MQHFSGPYKTRMLLFLLINVKMPTIVGILTFISMKNSMLNSVEHEIFFYNIGARLSPENDCVSENDNLYGVKRFMFHQITSSFVHSAFVKNQKVLRNPLLGNGGILILGFNQWF